MFPAPVREFNGSSRQQRGVALGPCVPVAVGLGTLCSEWFTYIISSKFHNGLISISFSSKEKTEVQLADSYGTSS